MNDYRVLNRGLIKDGFPGVPEDISSIFRYIDGHYTIYYTYNEFKKQFAEAGHFNWNILEIYGPNKGLLAQLKYLLTK